MQSSPYFRPAILLSCFLLLAACTQGQGTAVSSLTQSPVPPAVGTPAATLTPGAVLPLLTLVGLRGMVRDHCRTEVS